jgi:hypothetical protein
MHRPARPAPPCCAAPPSQHLAPSPQGQQQPRHHHQQQHQQKKRRRRRSGVAAVPLQGGKACLGGCPGGSLRQELLRWRPHCPGPSAGGWRRRRPKGERREERERGEGECAEEVCKSSKREKTGVGDSSSSLTSLLPPSSPCSLSFTSFPLFLLPSFLPPAALRPWAQSPAEK